MKLNLKNPIVFFDLETTGTNINSDRIVEICYLKVYPNGNEESKTMRINPEMHIPAEASAVHGIYEKMWRIVRPLRKWHAVLPMILKAVTLRVSIPTVSIFRYWRRNSCVQMWTLT